MNKNDIQRKIAALVAPLVISSSVASLPAIAANYGVSNDAVYSSVMDSNIFDKLNCLVPLNLKNSQTVYIYMNNDLENTELQKQEALNKAYSMYGRNYNIFKKNHTNTFAGAVYAVSDKNYVEGWTKINANEIRSYESIATTIEYGEYLADSEDFSSFRHNMNGYAYLSNEIVYLGNNDTNELLNKNDAIYYARNRYNVFTKSVRDNNNRVVRLYALSTKSSVDGWTKTTMNNVEENAFIATNPLFAEATFNIYNQSLRYNYNYDYDYNYNKNNNNNNINNYNVKNKKEALQYAYNNYDSFCILTRTYNGEVLYTFNNTPNVSDWSIIANDFVPSDAKIFMSMNDAENYIRNNRLSTNNKIDYNYNYYYENKYDYTPIYNEVNQSRDMKDYDALVKSDALIYAENNYRQYFVLAKSVNDLNNNTSVVYTLSTTYKVEGWTIIGNDNIPSNAYIFKNINDANSYINYLNSNYSRTLR